MKHNNRVLAKWSCVLGLGFALLVAHSNYYAADKPEESHNNSPAGTRAIGAWSEAIGEIRGTPTADGSRVKCSEVLNLPERVIVKTFQVYRNAYVIDLTKKTFAEAEGPMYVPRITSSWSEHHGKYFGGEKESVLAKWECRFPATKDLAIVVSSAVLELSDGRRLVCRFRPLVLSKGRVLAEDEAGEEDWKKD